MKTWKVIDFLFSPFFFFLVVCYFGGFCHFLCFFICFSVVAGVVFLLMVFGFGLVRFVRLFNKDSWIHMLWKINLVS